jgi:hypothetical protein
MSTFKASDLSLENVLRDVHDPVTQTLRTSSTATIVFPTEIDVNINATEDTIAIADQITGDTVKVEADGSINVNVGAVTNPAIVNFNIPMPNTEYNYTLPANTKRFLIKCRNNGILKLSYVSGQSGTLYLTIPAGSSYREEGISSALTLFFQSSKGSEVLEIVSWS